MESLNLASAFSRNQAETPSTNNNEMRVHSSGVEMKNDIYLIVESLCVLRICSTVMKVAGSAGPPAIDSGTAPSPCERKYIKTAVQYTTANPTQTKSNRFDFKRYPPKSEMFL